MTRRERRLLRRSGKKYVRPEDHATEPGAEQAGHEHGSQEGHIHKSAQAQHEKRDHKERIEKRERSFKENLDHFYGTQYKKLLVIPFIILAIAIIFLFVNFAVTGEFVNKGVSLKGGVTLSVPTSNPFDISSLESFLKSEFPKGDVSVRAMSRTGETIGFIIDASDVDQDRLMQTVDAQVPFLAEDMYSIENIGSALGESFFKETLIALLIAFVFMGVVVFFYFRTFAPSIAVILAAVSDMIVTLAVIDLFGIKLSTAGVAAFLMLIGYSVDTDILLSTRVLKSDEGTVLSRVYSAMKTGMTMTATTLAALVIVLIFSQSEVLKQIMLILLIGLVVDLIMTWIQNAGILRWYMEKRKVD